ncbi:MAG: DUF748 domain-containing protein [Candidatus Omnitrophota bacterium]
MKKILKILLWLVIVSAALLFIFNIVFIVAGKKIIVEQIKKNLKLDASLGSVSVSFPLAINMHNLEIAGLIKADSLYASPSLLGFFAGKIVLNQLRLVNLLVTLRKAPDGRLNMPQLPKKGKQPPVLVAALKVINGKLIFIDQVIDPQGYRVTVDNINIDIAKTMFPPTSLNVNFALSANLLDARDNPSGEAKASGWVDFGPKDMDGNITIKDVDVTKILPYMQGIISAKKLLSARLNFSADLKARNNELLIPSKMELDNIVYQKKEAAEGQPKEIDLVSNTIDLFSDQAGKMVFKFTLRTKLDKPMFDTKSLKGIFAQSAMDNLSSQSPDQLIKKAKDIAGEFKDFGKSFKKIFKQQD